MDEVYWDLLDNTNMLAVVRGFLGEDCLLHVNNTSKTPAKQGVHVDDIIYRYTPELHNELFARPQTAQLMCAGALALTDFTPMNGATWIFPGSHQWQELPRDAFAKMSPELPFKREIIAGTADPVTDVRYHNALREWAKTNKDVEPFQVSMKAGSVVLWAGGTWHQPGQASEDGTQDRTSVVFQFTRGTLRTLGNYSAWGLAQMPEDLVQHMPHNVRRLLGYYPSDGSFPVRLGMPPAPGVSKGLRRLLETKKSHPSDGSSSVRHGMPPAPSVSKGLKRLLETKKSRSSVKDTDSEEDLKMAFREADVDGDGYINYEEFVKMAMAP
eukprot:COSAG02_NODE_5008_length_4726_cov_3.358764_3_plen_326_part_00